MMKANLYIEKLLKYVNL